MLLFFSAFSSAIITVYFDHVLFALLDTFCSLLAVLWFFLAMLSVLSVLAH